MQAFGTWKGGYRTDLSDGRTHTVLVDLPRDEGGESAGTTPLELAVLSLAGGITTAFALVARRRRLEFQGMNVALQAERPKGAATFTQVHGTLRVRTRAGMPEVEAVLSQAIRTGPVSVLFEQAHVPIEIATIIEAPLVGGPARPSGPSP